jgi:hypothetical protein
MLHFLLGCWFGCFGGFMLAALLRKAGDSPAEKAEEPALPSVAPTPGRRGMGSESPAPSAN